MGRDPVVDVSVDTLVEAVRKAKFNMDLAGAACDEARAKEREARARFDDAAATFNAARAKLLKAVTGEAPIFGIL